LRLNESGVGLIVFELNGSFDGARLELRGESQTKKDGLATVGLTAYANLSETGNLDGEWETTTGSAGTFVLFPHDTASPHTGHKLPEQLYTARYNFGAVQIDRPQIIAVAESLQQEFAPARVIVTVHTASEQSHYLDEFKTLRFNTNRAEVLKILAQEAVRDGIRKIVSVEFGPHVNIAMTQGSSEAWVLGRLEKLKRDLGQFERTYATNFRRLGFGFNQFLFVAAIVFLPSLESLRDRIILMAGVVALIVAVDRLHRRYIPFAAIRLSERPKSWGARIAPSLISWVIAATASFVAAMLAAYLQGWLPLPHRP
jgi:hypothetical protein